MVGLAVRITGAWVVTTALIVLGVDAAVERVVSDVAIERPAPMTQGEVDEQLRERHGHAPTTGSITSPTSTPTSPGPATPLPPPSTTPPPMTRSDPPDVERGPDLTSGPDAEHPPPPTAPRGDTGQDGSQRP